MRNRGKGRTRRLPFGRGKCVTHPAGLNCHPCPRLLMTNTRGTKTTERHWQDAHATLLGTD